MADIQLKCPECSRVFVVSEYISGATASCPQCGVAVAKPTLTTAQQERKMSIKEVAPLPAMPAAVARPGDRHADTPSSRMSGKTRGPKFTAGLAHALGWVCGLLVFGVMVYLQKRVQGDREGWWVLYKWTRVSLWALVFLPVLYKAFRESSFSGWMGLVFPPYLAYFALERVDSFWMRSAALALLLSLGTERYLIPVDSLVSAAQAFLDVVVNKTRGLIKDAGEAPVF